MSSYETSPEFVYVAAVVPNGPVLPWYLVATYTLMVCDVCMALNSSLCAVFVLLQMAMCVAGRREIGVVTALRKRYRFVHSFPCGIKEYPTPYN